MRSILILFLLFTSANLEPGKQLFDKNCIVCHLGGKNLILPEKNLKKDALEANGMATTSAISYQVLNGKNGMPAFGGRLTEKEIEEIANYVLIRAEKNYEDEKK
jgi:cytochrome c6